MSYSFISNVLNGWSHPLQVGAKTFVVNLKQIPGLRRLLFQLQNITLDLGRSRRRTKENVRLFWWSRFRVASWKYYYSQTTDVIAPASLPSLYSFHWTLELIPCLHLITLILQIQLTYHHRFKDEEVPSSIMYLAVDKTLQRKWRVHADAWMKNTGDSNALSSKGPTLSWILTYLNTLQAKPSIALADAGKIHKKKREVLLIVAYKLETRQGIEISENASQAGKPVKFPKQVTSPDFQKTYNSKPRWGYRREGELCQKLLQKERFVQQNRDNLRRPGSDSRYQST